ncbi:MAG TPA: WcaF family extracellular polysaccharide biosynthesis acetyltransferase [Phycisphaeraceae bacterium]
MFDVMIITYNEALNLPHCLQALGSAPRRVFVIDSGSTDGTQDIARAYGAQVVHHDWEGYARQKNWGLEHLPFESDWVLILDADEMITPRLREQLLDIASKPLDQVPENGFFINRLTYFMGRPIRHCGYFPNYNMRFLKRSKGRYEDREVHEHVIIDDPVGYIREPMLHQDRRGMEHYVAKHNRYSTLEARSIFRAMTDRDQAQHQVNIPRQTRHHRWLKLHIMPYIPLPGLWRFLYMYVLRLGFLDGAAGFQFCAFISLYDSLVALKLKELRRSLADPEAATVTGLVLSEGQDPVVLAQQQPALASVPASEPAPLTQTQPEPSPWTFWEKVRRAVWMIFGKPLFRASFHNWYGFRRFLLRLFGAKIGRDVTIRPTVNIEIPWQLEIHDRATVGDYAILYCLGKITIGRRSVISQYAHLCAGTHDYTDHRFQLIRSPITIGQDVWIGADAFIGPGVTVGSLAVVGARSSVYKNLAPAQVYVGNPARPIKERVLR